NLPGSVLLDEGVLENALAQFAARRIRHDQLDSARLRRSPVRCDGDERLQIDVIVQRPARLPIIEPLRPELIESVPDAGLAHVDALQAQLQSAVFGKKIRRLI